ncbi:hypothetical protein BHAOGJBA_6177 [Methylobacterium hispanicum]|jgi:hypothetical protein|uniref:Uncharacterized protein n=1 Tax=Methylobacterium hispanicum TaxID=270350 RepID=A0AAV4ZYS2_9HYPH|nr:MULTISPECIES: hypothetical protein [Methylobacterium]GJD92621.1 hypothetical protein BHAOGJBA_6177 [Methylobacterium hispanicum]
MRGRRTPERQDSTKLVYLTLALHERLRAAAAGRGQSINALILEACEAYLAGEATGPATELAPVPPPASARDGLEASVLLRVDAMQAEIDALRADLGRLASQVVEVVEAQGTDPAAQHPSSELLSSEPRSQPPGPERAPACRADAPEDVPEGVAKDGIVDAVGADGVPADPAPRDARACVARPVAARSARSPLSRREQVRRTDRIGAALYLLLEEAGRSMERGALARLLGERGILAEGDRLDQIIEYRTRPGKPLYIRDTAGPRGRIRHNPDVNLPDDLRSDAAQILGRP